MKYRMLGKTGFQVSELSLGTWQVGGRWGGPFDDSSAEEIINRAIDLGVNFVDTADVYSDGLSEAAVGRVVSSRSEEVFVATKCGRQISPHVSAGYTPEVLEGYVNASLKNMGVEALDLIQLHCPPTEVFYRPEIFALFDRLKQEGKIRNLGVSVEKVEEAIKAIEYPNVTTVQIIFNMFRHRPSELFFSLAKEKSVGIIVRVPLASGLLSGKMTRETTFGPHDHRAFNRDGAAFDKGETFSGVDFETGLDAVDELRKLFPGDANLAAWALRWVLMFDEVSCVIPGASKLWHVESNVAAGSLPPLSDEQMAGVREVYETYIRPQVHHLW
jgi:aryl-alcohol dehydrogenase-like predicted oxidoreductase